MVTLNNRGMVGSSSHQHQQQRSYGISEMAAEKVGGSSVSSAAEMMNNNGSKVGAGYRWNGNGDAMMLGRRRVGLSNGGSVSDGSSEEEEEEEEEVEEDVADELSDDGEGLGAEEEEEHEAVVRDRGGSSRGRDVDRERERERERVGFDDAGTGTEDEGFDEPGLPDSPSPQSMTRVSDGREMSRGDMRGPRVPASRERMREMLSPDEVRESNHRQRMRDVSSPEEEGQEATDDSEGERAMPVSRAPDRNPVAAHDGSREMVVLPEKGPRGMVDTTKRKIASGPLNGVEPKKRERVPSTNSSRRRSTGTGERTRFSTDNKARVTLERAREILAAVKAAMVNDPKQFAMRHAETRAVENSSSSEDEKPPLQLPPPRHHVMIQQQVRMEEKVVKKRSRPPKGDKEIPPRRRKPKVEVDFHASDEKNFHRRPQAEGTGHAHAFKPGHFSSSGVEFTREGRGIHDGDGDGHYERKESREEGFEQQITPFVEKKVRRRKKKDGDDAVPQSTGLCPGSAIRNENWEPPASPFGLIQESLYKDPWKVLLSCMLLNKTAGRQVLPTSFFAIIGHTSPFTLYMMAVDRCFQRPNRLETKLFPRDRFYTSNWHFQMHKVIWDLFSLCPDAESAINTDTAKIAEKVYSLGLQNKRAKMIQRFSLEYLRGDWTNVTQLHGIGKYAADAYAIFCQGLWRDVEPDDLQLAKYWKWLWETDGQGNGFTPDNS